MKKSILLFIAIIVLGGAYYAYKMYTKPHTNVSETKAVVTINALDLFNAFDTNEADAMATYSDQVIQVVGIVSSIDLSNENEPQIVLEANGDNGFIRCGFKPAELSHVQSTEIGESINVKGECFGMNGSEELDLLADKDVVISNSIIIE